MLILCVDSWYAKWKETNPLSCPQFFKQTMCEDIDLILTKMSAAIDKFLLAPMGVLAPGSAHT